VATITQLGFNIRSDWDGSGVRAARAELDLLRQEMRQLSGAALHIDVVADTAKAKAEMKAFRDEAHDLDINVNLATAQASADLQRLKAQAGEIGISFDVNQGSYRSATLLIDYLTRDRTVNIDVDLDNTSYSGVATWLEILARDRTVNIDVDRSGLDNAAAGFNNVGRAAGGAGEQVQHMSRMMKLAIAGTVAAIAVLPAAISMVGAALMTLPGLAAIGLGGYFLWSITEVSDAFTDLGTTMTEVGVRAAEPMKRPLLDALKEIGQWAKDNEALFKQMYTSAAKLIAPLTDSLKGFMDKMLPGVNAALAASVPFFQQFGDGFENVGDRIGNMFQAMSTEAEEFGRTWNLTFTFLGDIMQVFGEGSARMVGNANKSMSETMDSLMGFFRGMLDGLTGFTAATGQAEGGLGFFQTLGDLLREILPPLGQFYAALSTALGPALNEIWVAIGKLVGAFLQSLVPVFLAIAPILLDAAKGFAQIVEWIKPIMPVLGPVIAGIWLLNSAILANPIVALVVGITLLVGWLVTWELKTRTLRDTWNSVWEKIGDPLKNFGNAVAELWDKVWGFLGPKFGEMWVAVKDAVVDAWHSIQPALVELKEQFAPLWEAAKPVLAALGGALLLLGTIIVDVFLHVIKPVIGGIAGAIHAAVQIISGAIKVITGILEIWVGVFKVITNVVMIFFSLFTGGHPEDEGRVQALKNAWEGLLHGFQTLFRGVAGIIDAIWDSIYNVFKMGIGLVIGVVRGFIGGIIDFFTHLWDVLVGHSIVPDTINSIVEWFFSLPGKLFGMLTDFVSGVVGFFFDLSKRAVGALLDLGGKLWDTFSNAFMTVIRNIPTAITNIVRFYMDLPGKIFSALSSLAQFLWNAFSVAFTRLLDYIPGQVARVVNFYKELPGKIWEAMKNLTEMGKNVVEGFWNGLFSMKDWLIDKIKSFFTDSVPGAIRKVLEIFSPSKVTEELGANTGEGFAVGLDGEQGNVQSSAQALANKITEVKVPAVPFDDVMKEFIKSTGTATEKLGILNGGLSKYREDLFSTEDVQAKVNSTMRDLTDSLVGFNGTMILSSGRIDTGTEAGMKMYNQMKEVVTSFDNAGAAAYKSAIDQGMSQEQAAQAAYDASLVIRDSFVRQAMEAGLTNEQAVGLANTYKMFPDDIKTQFLVDLKKADDDVREFMERQRTIAINYKYTDSEIAAARPQTPGGPAQGPVLMPNGTYRANGGWIPGLAEGGFIVGPGGPTEDLIAGIDRRTGLPSVQVSAGEFVVNAKAASENRSALEAMNSGKKMQKLATGGSIADGEAAASAITATGTAALDEMLKSFSENTTKVLMEIQTKWTTFLATVKTGVDTWIPTYVSKWDEFLTGNDTRLTKHSTDSQATWTTLWQKVTDQSVTTWANLRAKWDEFSAGTITTLNSLRDTVSQTWTALWDATLQKSSDVWTAIAGKFGELRTSIAGTMTAINEDVDTTWSRIVEIFRTPVTGVVRIWNDVSGAFGLEKIEGFATGGAVFGAGTTTSDDIPARLSRGEHVWTAAEVDAAGGHSEVYKMRRSVLDGNEPGFAGGGAVEWMVGQKNKVAPALSMTSGERYTDNGYHSKGQAADFSNGGDAGTPEMKAFANWIADTWGRQTLELIHSPFNRNIKNGGDVGDGMGLYGGGTMAGHRNHVHWAVPGPLNDDARGSAIPGGPGSMSMGPSPEQIQKHKDAVAGIKAIIDATNAARGELGITSPAGDIGAHGTERVGNGAIGKLDAALASAAAAMGGSIPEGERRAIIEKAMEITNTPPPSTKEAWLAGMNTLIERESGWNAGARNDWDSNAAMGQNSGGLTQTIPSTFNAHKVAGYDNMYAPVDNVAASINYIKSRYGSIENVQQANANMPPKGYADGTNNAQGGWNLVGENGPEMVKFRGGEQVKTFNDIIAAIKDEANGSSKALESKVEAALKDLGDKVIAQLKTGNADLRSALQQALAQAGMEINIPVDIAGTDVQEILAQLQAQLLPKLEMMLRQGVGAAF
jgi:SLT domain-containing protein/phage-related protein